MPLSDYKATLLPHHITSNEFTIKFSTFKTNYVELEFYEKPNKVFNIPLSLVMALDNYFNKFIDYFSPDFWRGMKVTLIVIDNQICVKIPIKFLFGKTIDETYEYREESLNDSLTKKIGSLNNYPK